MSPTLLPTARDESSPLDVVTAVLDTDGQTPDRLMDALGALIGRPHLVAGWLRALDPDAVAARSYWHPNGFAKLVLHATTQFKVRLHVWPDGPDREGETNPHGHRWDFASAVLCGDGIRSTEFEEASHGTPYTRHDYVGNSARAPLTPSCTVVLAVTCTRDIGMHHRYAVTTGTLHTVDPIGTRLVATLVVQGRPKMTSAPVYCPPGSDTDQPGLPILPTEVRSLLDAVASAPDGPWE